MAGNFLQRGRWATLGCMLLLPELSQAVQKEIETVDRAKLVKAAEELTAAYKGAKYASPAMKTPAHRAAYLAVRFPAVFAANLRVLSEVQRLAPEAAISSILDIGAGPGTAFYAAAQTYPSLSRATLIEGDGALIELGKRLSGNSSHAAMRNARWIQQDIGKGLGNEAHDLVMLSYTVGELSPAEAERLVLDAWRRTKQFLAIIEPGTVRGFDFVLKARTLLIGSGGHVLAPCPHTNECPMVAAGDWCHFAARVQRTSLHRQIKHGALGHEDEKFSYIVLSRNSTARTATRIVRHPQKHSGHVQLTLCTPDGLKRETITRSQKDAYKLARHAEWGDSWSVADDAQ